MRDVTGNNHRPGQFTRVFTGCFVSSAWISDIGSGQIDADSVSISLCITGIWQVLSPGQSPAVPETSPPL